MAPESWPDGKGVKEIGDVEGFAKREGDIGGWIGRWCHGGNARRRGRFGPAEAEADAGDGDGGVINGGDHGEAEKKGEMERRERERDEGNNEGLGIYSG